MKNEKKQYGIYLMNEAQGRGTDIPTNDEIESNGGSFLMILDVFSKRSEEQIKGRIGRLNTKGKWQRVLYSQGSKDSAAQLIYVHQNTLELNDDKKFSTILSKIQSEFEVENEDTIVKTADDVSQNDVEEQKDEQN